MLTSPPESEAATNPGIDVAPDRAQCAEEPADTYPMHTGVLDTLRR